MEQNLNSHVLYLPEVFEGHRDFFERLRTEVAWTQKMWTRGPLPRLCCHSVQNFKVGSVIVEWLKMLFKNNFNSEVHVIDVFGNYYRDGNDYLPHHRDNYSTNEVPIHVVSVSFGAQRRFSFKREGKVESSYSLGGGDLIVFDPYMNEHFTHGISKLSSLKEGRINLTCFVTFDRVPYDRKIDGIVISADEIVASKMQLEEWR